ncbi:hypothetical protein J5N97_005586 [Dioscorea zingiberensis]|uniref:Uncharacterized protein n=1 Tax=Dioscorea zingiberensis TaxID=325984 RepID=A0A9D5D8F9_9LILI|nr:hypothetical protein J5N97_005586 [Dioscorea zingiberensis]
MEAEPIPSSPTISSLSSSDLDTESTGSFFPDRSTSLGTLMGVTFPDPPARLPSRRSPTGDASRRSAPPPAPHHRRRRLRRRGSWWRLCRDETVHTSLGEFLQVERRLADASSTHGHFIYGGAATEHEAVGGGPLFEDGRVLPPQDARGPRGRPSDAPQAGSTIRFPVLLAGICSGGEGSPAIRFTVQIRITRPPFDNSSTIQFLMSSADHPLLGS